MKKKQNNCKHCQASKRCVFRAQNTTKQEMLQSKALLSERTFQIMLSNGLERPCQLNVRAYRIISNATEPLFSPQAHGNHTLH